MEKKFIGNKEEDYSKWYLDLISKAELADYGPSKGSMIIRPRGLKIWNKIQNIFNEMLEESGHQNAYFPTLIPESFIAKEKDHVEGFAPELFTISSIGGKKLDENLVLRPSSETIIWNSFRNWIKSYKDLPLLLNQWANVFRAELRTKPFLRTSEFLWQEGHTAHKDKEEALKETMLILSYYKKLIQDYLAIPVLDGVKTESEKFAGAVETYAIELMLQDKKALQGGTSHYLGQNFSRAFDVKFVDSNGKEDFPHSTSWGFSTRLIGAIIMSHSDERGLVLPPKIATEKIAIVPIFKQNNKGEVLNYAEKIKKILLQKFKEKELILDSDEDKSPGWKFSQYELLGIPLRIEIGERDIKESTLVLSRRDTFKKTTLKIEEIIKTAEESLDSMQKELFEKRLNFYNENTHYIKKHDELLEFFKEEGGRGFAICSFKNEQKIEKQIKEETRATVRIIPLESDYYKDRVGNSCIISGEKNCDIGIFARAH